MCHFSLQFLCISLKTLNCVFSTPPRALITKVYSWKLWPIITFLNRKRKMSAWVLRLYTVGLELPGQELPGQRWNSPDRFWPAKNMGIPRTTFFRKNRQKNWPKYSPITLISVLYVHVKNFTLFSSVASLSILKTVP